MSAQQISTYVLSLSFAAC